MITRSKKIIYDFAVALFLLAAFAGCAQTRTNIKDAPAVENNGAAFIQAIKSSSDGVQIEVQTNKPISYTYYKTSDPPKVVIDLAQIEPGSVEKQLEFNSENIKRIEVTKHDFTGGFLSRVEIMLNQDKDDFTVATDPVERGKLLISFPQTPNDAVPDSVAKVETNPANLPLSDNTVESQKVDDQTVKSDEKALVVVEDAPSSLQGNTETNAKSNPSVTSDNQMGMNENGTKVSGAIEPSETQPVETKLLREVSATNDGIEINIRGGVDSYNVFKLTKPDRIVLDLPGVKSGLAAKAITINKFDVGQVRQGIYPDKIRIVFDAEKATLPPYQVVKDNEGLKVVFVGVPMANNAQVRADNVKAPIKASVVEKRPDMKKGSAIEAIDFKIIDELSRVEIQTSGDCKAADPVKVTGGLSLTIKNCQIPKHLQRMIDTSAFPSVVKMITPYQVKMKRENDVRIMVKLRQAASSVLKKEGETIFWDIKNPKSIKSEAMISRKENLSSEIPTKAYDQSSEASEIVVQNGKDAPIHDIKQVSEPKIAEKKIYTGRKVSLEFSDADIRKILQLIAEVSNLNFLIGDDVSGTISIKLVNVPWDQALDVILDSKGLEMRRDGNIMYVKPKGKFKTEEQEEAEAKKEREARMELKTRVFDINFADVSDISKQFDKMKSERGTTAKDDRTNRVIVTDIEDRLEKMRNLLKELDLPEKQVMIEARMVEATSAFARDLGVKWGIHYTPFPGNLLGMTNVDVGLGGIITPGPDRGEVITNLSGGQAGITFGKLTSTIQLDLRLSAAANINQIKIISSPKVLTLNNKTAKISQGTSIPYQSQTATEITTIFVEAALTLEVTPHVAADGTITMKIKATNDSPGSDTPNAGPQINKKEAKTEVQIKNGETVVIGGIYQDSDNVTDSGVPFLMDIPLLGWLFKSNAVNKTKTELLIFITPKIVN